MNIIDIKCQDSVNSSLNCCHLDLPEDPLRLGRNNQIYLFFSLPPFLTSKQINGARLVLYKSPPFGKETENAEQPDNKYYLFPLLDYFSIYDCLFGKPPIDSCRRVIFYNDYCKSYTEIDVTDIVKAWLDLSLENKGLLLAGNKHSQCVFYVSNRCAVEGMSPTLRLICSGLGPFPTPALSCADCNVTINRPK